jgi:hypothetical protein
MRRALRIHPDFPRGPVKRIEVEIDRPRPQALAITYELTGEISAIRFPAPAKPERADGLWRRTCFEAFVSPADGPAYLEFNLSPSGRWAAYGFDDYRAGMTPLEVVAPRIEVVRDAQTLTLRTRLDLAAAPGIAGSGDWRVGLSAVIEDHEGRIAYWALAHPPGKPDFHHADGFACLVRAPEDA